MKEQVSRLREALSNDVLKSVYHRIARRYDFQHGLITAWTDQKARKMLINNAVTAGDHILDCGSGTGTTGIMAALKAGPDGSVTFFDLSDDMLRVAERKADREGLQGRISFQTGDMVRLSYDDDSFDVVLSTFSLCPLYDPHKGALELYRVTRPGGKIGIAHSTEPESKIVRWLADRVEDIAWHFPLLSMGCRSVSVKSALQKAGGKVVLSRNMGFPLWPFHVFIVQKPAI